MLKRRCNFRLSYDIAKYSLQPLTISFDVIDKHLLIGLLTVRFDASSENEEYLDSHRSICWVSWYSR